jgi:hypothetical protein
VATRDFIILKGGGVEDDQGAMEVEADVEG